MKDYEKQVEEMTGRANFYMATLQDMNSDHVVDNLVVKGREEIRGIGYRIPWPSFSSISLTYECGKYEGGEFEHFPSMSYTFTSTDLPDEYYLGLLELGANEITTTHIAKVYAIGIGEPKKGASVKFTWRVRCKLSDEDRALLKSMGVIKTRDDAPMFMPSNYETISCG